MSSNGKFKVGETVWILAQSARHTDDAGFQAGRYIAEKATITGVTDSPSPIVGGTIPGDKEGIYYYCDAVPDDFALAEDEIFRSREDAEAQAAKLNGELS